MLNVRLSAGDKEFICSARQAAAIQRLIEARKGGFARIKGYVSKTDYITPKTSDITALTRISVLKVYERKIDALHALTFDDVKAAIRADSRLKRLADDELRIVFDDRRSAEIASMERTLAGERDDARRIAADTYYATIDTGVAVHFKTEKRGGETYMVRDGATGLPIAESIMLTYIPVSETVLVEGVRKTVNSGNPVLMSNVIKSLMPKGCKLQKASLKEDNFDSIVIDGDVVLPAEIAGMFT